MILIVDSGSTKTDWLIVKSNEELNRILTNGINPVFKSAEQIAEVIRSQKQLISYADEIRTIYYYGAGCSDDINKLVVKEAIASVFKDASIFVEHDMLGSALSVCKNKPGVVCILGTGSNCCFFDGNNVTPAVHGVGYILGDEGSGSYLGKKLLKAYLYNSLPDDLITSFRSSFVSDRNKIMDSVYRNKNANLYLASFTPFISENISHKFIYNLVEDCIDDFFQTNVLSYSQSKDYPVHFVGSVAWVFKDIVQKVGNKYHLKLGNIIQKPIDGLLKYHTAV
jgi:N-acetylglucosamine kinase-like BadF-type ATPase